MWTIFIAILSTAIVCSSTEIGAYDYDNKIEENSVNDRDNLTSNVYVLPDQIFNDGKPFYVKKDESGSIDFNAKTTPESLPIPTDAASTQNIVNNSQINRHDISLDKTVQTQNIHDYLNLPVKYQSSKFVYPLVSSSYANLKYQGNNKNYISNHKYDSSTVKSVAYTTKKYNKSTYPTKTHLTSLTSKSSTTESYESTTKVTPLSTTTNNSSRKYANIPSRTTTPGRRYTTVSRVSSTTMRNSLPNSEIKFNRVRSTTTSTTQRPYQSHENSFVTPVSTANLPSLSTSNTPIINSTKESDGMISDFFSYFFNNENNENKENNDYSEEIEDKPTTRPTPSTTVISIRPTVSTTQAPVITRENENAKPYTNRYNITIDSATRKPINKTEATDNRVAYASTASPVYADYGEKTTANAGKFRPPSNVNNIRVSPGAQIASFVTNGQVSAGLGNVPYSEQSTYKGQFQPPAQNNMNNIVVRPDSNSASFVATGQLQTTTRFDQKFTQNDNNRRPISNNIDETTKPGITFISKGQVTSAEAYDHPAQNNVVFHGPSANSNNIVIAPGTKVASFVTSGQLSMGADNGSAQNQHIKNIENEINAYGPGLQSTQRPHGFQLPSTTAIPKPVNTVIAQSINDENQTQHVRFPENAEKLIGAQASNQPDAINNNTIKFPTNQLELPVIEQIPIVQQAPVADGLIKFTPDVRNEIFDGIDPNNFPQIIQTAHISPPVNNFVVFRQPAPIAMQQPIIGMNVPAMIRNTPFVFKKPTFIQYPPRKNYTLPNILPQFRPTQPQQQISLNPEIANQLRQSQLNRAQFMYNAQNMRFKAPPQYLYSQRPMQIRPSINEQNRRHFELHPGNFNQRIYDRPLLPHLFNRNAIGANALLVEPQRFEENMKVTATNGDMDNGKNVDFENGDGKLIQPIVESQKEIPKVEPVTTLQMIQQQRLLQKTGAIVAVNGLSSNRNSNITIDAKNGKTEKPLYVVYPMQKQAVANGLNPMQRGNGEIATILADQMHKPATIQQLGLPYTLEKNKSRYILNSRPAYEFEKKSEQQQDPIAAENDEEDSDRPIAIAYSPTEPNPSHLADVYRPTQSFPTPTQHSTPVFVNAVNDENQNVNQQFQAPFIPSINLENTQSTHNGWAIVTPPSVFGISKTESKNHRISASLVNSNSDTISISRSDSVEIAESDASVEKTTKKFDFDSFKPDLQGGFMPIYKTALTPIASSQEKNEPSRTKSDEKSDRSDISLESLIYDDDEI